MCVRARARPRRLESERFPPCAVHEYSCLVYSIFLCTLQTGGRVWMMNVRTYLGTSRQPGKFMQLLSLLITCGLKGRKKKKTSEDRPGCGIVLKKILTH